VGVDGEVSAEPDAPFFATDAVTLLATAAVLLASLPAVVRAIGRPPWA
jgi:hypothetical protein